MSYYYTKKCLDCEKEFKSIRSDAKYCPGGKCRKRADRKRQQLEKTFTAAVAHIDTLFTYQNHPDFGKAVSRWLEQLWFKLEVTDKPPAAAAAIEDRLPAALNVPRSTGADKAGEAAPGRDLSLIEGGHSSKLDFSVTSTNDRIRLGSLEFDMREIKRRVDALEEAFEAVAG